MGRFCHKGFIKKSREGRLSEIIEYEIVPGTQIIATDGPFVGLEGYVIDWWTDLRCVGWGKDRMVCKFPDSKIKNERVVESNKFNELMGRNRTPVDMNIDYLTVDQIDLMAVAAQLRKPKIFTRNWKMFEESIEELRFIDQELLYYFKNNPKSINKMHPAGFEELIKHIYVKNGFEIESMGKWNQADGGVDVFAVQRNSLGQEIKFAIQCKRSKNRIKPSVIRELNGVLDKSKSHLGVVATSSEFTRTSISEANELWRIELQDLNYIVDRINEFFE